MKENEGIKYYYGSFITIIIINEYIFAGVDHKS